MPFPTTQSAMFASGYEYLRWEKCTECGLAVEVWSTPGKREIVMEPMVSSESPATRHFEKCNIAPKQEEANGSTRNDVQDAQGRNSDSGAGSVHEGSFADSRADIGQRIHNGGCDARGSGIKLPGVTDHNHQIIAVGWDDGVLVCQFKTAKWSYAGVPEAEFVKLRRSPFAYRIFTLNIKNKFPATKVA